MTASCDIVGMILKANGYIVTNSNANSDEGPVNVIYTVIDRHDLGRAGLWSPDQKKPIL